jgi:hypothetical protein
MADEESLVPITVIFPLADFHQVSTGFFCQPQTGDSSVTVELAALTKFWSLKALTNRESLPQNDSFKGNVILRRPFG